MRKLLLASAAMLGATSGLAMAQAPFNPTQGQMVSPGNPITPSSSFDMQNATGRPSTYVGGVGWNPLAVPAPGTVVIHLGGKVEIDLTSTWTTNNQAFLATVAAPVAAGTAVSAAGTVGTAPAVINQKVNPIAFGSFMRLYPGVDGMATNGLRYGASVEFRENFPGSGAQPFPQIGALGQTAAAPTASAYSSGQTVFVRRAFAYLANDNLGILRMGNSDGVIGLFDNGTFSAQNYDAGAGNFNGGPLQGESATGAMAIPFAWLAQAGAEYGNTKAVYLSPQFFGLDFAVQYAPSMGNGNSGCTTAGNTGCTALTSGSDGTRWYNQVAAGVRYQGVFGPVGIGAYAMYETAGKESVTSPGGGAVSFARNGAGTAYDNLSFIQAASYVALTTGVGKFTLSGDYIGGALNNSGQLAMRPTGGASENAELVGLLYNNGPITLEAEAGLIVSQGAPQLTAVSQRREMEAAFGGNYNLAPGLYLVGEYMYCFRHQAGFDFIGNGLGAGSSGAVGTSAWKAGATRDAHGQGVMFSTVVNW